MAAITISIQPDELQGLHALAEFDEAASGRKPDVAGVAAVLMHGALAARLEALGLGWAPPPEAARRLAASAAEPASARPARPDRGRPGKYVTSALAAAVLVVLWGGYTRGWNWTGFRANGQLWDWLSLLLLPVVVGLLPLWIQHAGHICRARRVAGLAAVAAFAGFAAAGYMIPLPWTGFRGQTLWDWFGLLLLPAVLAIAPLWPKDIRSLRPGLKRAIGFVVLSWAATIIGGYALSWDWTGYQGNTLWDWLRLLLLPLVVPTLLVPAMFSRIAGHGTRPAPQASTAAPAEPGRHGGLRAGAAVRTPS
jgi:hypothetical protein